MTTFHPFPRLPPELRLRIWELTVEPRTVDFRIKTDVDIIDSINGSSTEVLQLEALSSTPPPATLQTCRESRNHLQKRVYEQVFRDIVNPARDSRYIYFHFPLDILDIGTTLFHHFFLFSDLSYSQCLQRPSRPISIPSRSPTPTPLAAKIIRLKFTRNFGDEYLDRWEIKDGLTHFVNLKEVFCVCGDGIMAWNGATEWIGFERLSCGKEGVWLIDRRDKDEKVRRAVEWDEVWRAFKRETEREREYAGGGGHGGRGYW